MDKSQLQALLDVEVAMWAKKSCAGLAEELADIKAYQRGSGAGQHQFEVLLLERKPDYVHVSVSIDDGSFSKSLVPLTSSFIVYKDGRVDIG